MQGGALGRTPAPDAFSVRVERRTRDGVQHGRTVGVIVTIGTKQEGPYPARMEHYLLEVVPVSGGIGIPVLVNGFLIVSAVIAQEGDRDLREG